MDCCRDPIGACSKRPLKEEWLRHADVRSIENCPISKKSSKRTTARKGYCHDYYSISAVHRCHLPCFGVLGRLASDCFQGSVRSLSFQQVFGLFWTANQGRLCKGVERSLGWRHTSALISGLAECPTGERHCHGNC